MYYRLPEPPAIPKDPKSDEIAIYHCELCGWYSNTKCKEHGDRCYEIDTQTMKKK